jgi:hypothetical protein
MKKISMAKKKIPFAFALEALDALWPTVKPMFGGYIVYVGEKLILFLYDQEKWTQFQGVSLATTPEHYHNLAQEFSLAIGDKKIGKHPWLLIPANSAEFEEQVLNACELILKGDSRIGRAPEPKKFRSTDAKKSAKRENKSN